jgi:hypothetical protein
MEIDHFRVHFLIDISTAREIQQTLGFATLWLKKSLRPDNKARAAGTPLATIVYRW